ncbi:hypothetical protein OJAV_G00184250 [Oryzias javanicus]|uniref:DNA/RNA non-specific endonuclease domain-containing protein n=1 Tax=Oryzias javanicus TaxID=123683 RepID=A0A437CDF1_ORYJA|nr:hypothetical protein OJAV_G00184250 [Oryzias javanicus]
MMSLFQGSSQTRSAFLFLFFLFSSFKPAQTEVVRSISDCADFLLNQSPPEIPNILKDEAIQDQNRYKPICQTYQNTRTFLTLYDTEEKIPVFSAIKFVQEREPGGRSKNQKWMIEPQLENESADKNMKNYNEQQGTYNHQASNSDYTNSGYSRGHVCPRSYASTQMAKTSTFTLTNVVPQVISFNSGSWEKMETCVKCFMEKFCKNNNGAIEGYVVAGAKPGDKKLNDRVNIPSMMWSAFCCYSSDKKAWLASAHWGYNIKEENKNVAKKKKKDKYLQTKTLNELYEKLGTVKEHFDVFPGTKCPLGTTVTEFYPDLDESCTCPPGAQRNTNKNRKNNNNKKKNRENKNIETKNKNKENKNWKKENKNRKKENKNKNKENKNRNKNKKRENKKKRAG